MSVRTGAAAMLLAVVASAAPTVARAQIPDDAIPLPTIRSETNTFRAEYAEYFNNKEISRLVGMYAPDAIVTNERGETLVGRAAIQAAFSRDSASLPHMILKSDSLIGYGRTAIDVGTVTMHPQGGGEVKGKYLVVLRKRMQVWMLDRVSVVPIPAKKM